MNPVIEQANAEKTELGFWVYLMTDCLLFGSLFAAYAVLHGNTFGGPGGRDLFSLPYVLAETLLLLTSSFTCGVSLLAAQARDKKLTLLLLGLTMLLGLAFLVLEVREFVHLYQEGNSWRRSGFLSAFFSLIGTHGLHITAGLIWSGTIVVQLLRRGLTPRTMRRLTLFSLFWHFLDLVWIFIFTLVYMVGAL